MPSTFHSLMFDLFRALLFYLWRAGTGRHAFAHISDTRANRTVFAVACFGLIAAAVAIRSLPLWAGVVMSLLAVLSIGMLRGPLVIGVLATVTAGALVSLATSAPVGLVAPYCIGLVWKLCMDYGRLPFEMRRTGYLSDCKVSPRS